MPPHPVAGGLPLPPARERLPRTDGRAEARLRPGIPCSGWAAVRGWILPESLSKWPRRLASVPSRPTWGLLASRHQAAEPTGVRSVPSLLPCRPAAETKTLPRSSSMAAGLERNGRMRVKAIFSHAAGDNSTLLSFKEGDLITLLVPEARDGWHYGESEKTKM